MTAGATTCLGTPRVLQRAGMPAMHVLPRLTSLAPAAGHRHPFSTQPGSLGAHSSQCIQFRVSTGVDSHISLQVMPCTAPNRAELRGAGTSTAPRY